MSLCLAEVVALEAEGFSLLLLVDLASGSRFPCSFYNPKALQSC